MIFDTFEDSEFHTQAASTLDSVDKWHLPTIVFHELIWFFRGRKIHLSRAMAKVVEYLTNEKTLFTICTEDDIRFASTRMRDYDEYNDLVILSVAKRLEQPLFTFDEQLKRLARRSSVRLHGS